MHISFNTGIKYIFTMINCPLVTFNIGSTNTIFVNYNFIIKIICGDGGV